jgi:anti-sigma factor RsiW
MKRLSETEAAPVKEHLLVCAECRGRLAEWDAYIKAMRAALKQTSQLTVIRLGRETASAKHISP